MRRQAPQEKAADQKGWTQVRQRTGEQHSRLREMVAEPAGVAGQGEGNATCTRNVLSGVGPGELSCVLGPGLWT